MEKSLFVADLDDDKDAEHGEMEEIEDRRNALEEEEVNCQEVQVDRVVLYTFHALLDETPSIDHSLPPSPQHILLSLALSLLVLLQRQLTQVLLTLRQQLQHRCQQQPEIGDGDEQPRRNDSHLPSRGDLREECQVPQQRVVIPFVLRVNVRRRDNRVEQCVGGLQDDDHDAEYYDDGMGGAGHSGEKEEGKENGKEAGVGGERGKEDEERQEGAEG